MQNLNTAPQALTDVKIEINLDELIAKLQTGSTRPEIVATAKTTLERVNNIWNPAIVYRWLPIKQSEKEPEKSVIQSDEPVDLDLGHSSIFIKDASYALIAAFSAGDEIEKETQRASDSKEILISFILDLIGLLVLEKAGDMVKEIAEEQARELGWGVSPFLSPGSIHGWELEDQLKLCPLLPLDKIDLQIREDAVLMPFKSLSCLIGIGAGYETTKVGTTCQVCSKNETCQMRQSTL
ncbi:MAG: hypothetical protein GY702_13425 [Desulfobulbaceae bacterium]|nr:hypothetical protein [Desulfobulbaceae bacterium]